MFVTEAYMRVLDWVIAHKAQKGSSAFTAGQCARGAKVSHVTARKYLRQMAEVEGFMMTVETAPYRSNVNVDLFRVWSA